MKYLVLAFRKHAIDHGEIARVEVDAPNVAGAVAKARTVDRIVGATPVDRLEVWEVRDEGEHAKRKDRVHSERFLRRLQGRGLRE